MSRTSIKFPQGFKWGTATASYQIEGAIAEDGRGDSIWDTFCRKPFKIGDKSSGEIACDHYHRFQDDFKILKSLNCNSYRFSIAWPRVFPKGTGTVNQKGLDFYSRMVDELLKLGIEPFVTLYHWDLPQKEQEKSGWYKRDTARHFADYTESVLKSLGDRVSNWITLNEPIVSYALGHVVGLHAPGHHRPYKAMKVPHNLLMAHGWAVERIRALSPKSQVGITNALIPAYPASNKDSKGFEYAQDFLVRLFLDPVLKGHYPKTLEKSIFAAGKEIEPGDMSIISQPLDFIGVNYYSRMIVKNFFLPPYFFPVKPSYPGVKFTTMNNEVFPQGFYDLLTLIRNEYNNPVVYITENGSSFEDKLENNKVTDIDRLDYLKKHLTSLAKVIDEGAKIKGYFLWSLLDNFEWSFGYTKRFGAVYVDYPTQRRVIKDSGLWYSEVCKNNEFSATEGLDNA